MLEAERGERTSCCTCWRIDLSAGQSLVSPPVGLQIFEAHGVFTLQDMGQMGDAHQNLEAWLEFIHHNFTAQVSPNSVTNHHSLLSGMRASRLGAAKSRIDDGLKVDATILCCDVALSIVDVMPRQGLPINVEDVIRYVMRSPRWLVRLPGREANKNRQRTAVP